MKIVLVLINYYLPGYKSGGPIQTISNTVSFLGNEVKFKIITLDRDATETSQYNSITPSSWNVVGKSEVYYLEKNKFLVKNLIKLIRKTDYDYLYLNSFFNPFFTITPLLALKLNLIKSTKTIVAPRGELSNGALSIKKQKKKIGLIVIKFLGLFKKIIWHASSDFEKKEILLNFKANEEDIIVAPNLSSPLNNLNNSLKVKERDFLKIIFVSRITQKKNLDFALEVLRKLTFPIEFSIVGPILETKYWESCQFLIKSLPNNIKVSYLGSISHENIVDMISNSDLFFLPTKGENFGHVIIEAASAGTPLLISNTTPWINLENLGIGWDLPLLDKNDFASKIILLNNMDNNSYNIMRQNVKKWVIDIKNNNDIIEKNKSLFN